MNKGSDNSETHRPQPEQFTARPHGRIAVRVYWLAALLIVLASSALLLVGYVAASFANQQAREYEVEIFQSALDSRELLTARDQLSLAQWDQAVEHIVQDFNPDFIRHEFIDSHWYDYGLDRSFLIAPGDIVLASAREGEVDFRRHELAQGSPLKVLADRVRAKFLTDRIETGSGYRRKAISAAEVAKVTEQIYARIDGEPLLLSAMAIVPDSEEIGLEDGDPVVLISARRVDAGFVEDLNAPLSLDDISFLEDARPGSDRAIQALTGIDGDILGYFHWKAKSPGQEIWSLVVPIVLVLAFLLTLAAFTVSAKIARLSASLEKSEAVNRHYARHDSLTGLMNRLAFSEQMEKALKALPEQRFALAACDLDRFKKINDTHGHAAGDIVLQVIAQRLQNAVGDDGIVGRVGGDEFVILLTGSVARDHLNALSARIIASLGKPIEVEAGLQCQVGISLGIAVAPECGKGEVELVNAADKALYTAKSNGRNQAVLSQLESGEKQDTTIHAA